MRTSVLNQRAAVLWNLGAAPIRKKWPSDAKNFAFPLTQKIVID
jgi:hypothetical protein